MSGRKLLYLLASVFVLTFLTSNFTSAATVFTEDFEGIDISGGPVAISTGNSAFTTNVSGGTFFVINDNPPPLPTGGANNFTGSQYLQYIDGSSSPQLRAPLSLPLNAGFVASFDYFEPNETTGTQTAFRFVLSNDTAATTTNRAVEINLSIDNDAASGTLAVIGGSPFPVTTLNANEMQHIDLVGSFSSGTTSYAAGDTFASGSVAQFTFDVYINGVLALDDAAFRNNLASANELGFVVSGSSSRAQTAYIDNLLIENSLPVPEPGACLLWSLALGGFVLRGNRRRSN